MNIIGSMKIIAWYVYLINKWRICSIIFKVDKFLKYLTKAFEFSFLQRYIIKYVGTYEYMSLKIINV